MAVNKNRRFTNYQARDIKSILAVNPTAYTALARLLKADSKTLYNIALGETYQDIDPNGRYPRPALVKSGTRGVRGFSDQQVRDIRQAGSMDTYNQLSRLLSVDSKTVYNLVNGTTYRDVA